MHSDWFNGIEILRGRWQHGEKVEYCYPSGLEKTLSKWEIYVPLVTKGLKTIISRNYEYICYAALHTVSFVHGCFAGKCILTGATEYRYFKVDGSMEKSGILLPQRT
jgi:hypothetical protein